MVGRVHAARAPNIKLANTQSMKDFLRSLWIIGLFLLPSILLQLL